MATEDTEFRGTYEQKLDVKGRLVVPPVFRRALGENWVITQGRGTCLEIRTDQGWRAEMERMRDKEQRGEISRTTLRALSANSFPVGPDVQGRILVPPPLRTYAALGGSDDQGQARDNRVAVIGVWDCVEIWRWDLWEHENRIGSQQLQGTTF